MNEDHYNNTTTAPLTYEALFDFKLALQKKETMDYIKFLVGKGSYMTYEVAYDFGFPIQWLIDEGCIVATHRPDWQLDFKQNGILYRTFQVEPTEKGRELASTE